MSSLDAPQLSIRLDGDQSAPKAATTDLLTAPNAAGAQTDLGALEQQQRQKWSPQQGNDIYLTCQLDANPRPNKPILWRHNGNLISLNNNNNNQQQQQQHSTIVMNNQSLVLRKINPNQSGLYTCESSNLLGTNSSLPIELNVRHAPICATDDM